MRKSNAESVLKTKNEYLHCNSKRNKPQLHHMICESRCKGYKNCYRYGEWYFEYYGKEIEKPKKKVRRKMRKTKLTNESV